MILLHLRVHLLVGAVKVMSILVRIVYIVKYLQATRAYLPSSVIRLQAECDATENGVIKLCSAY